jgi:cyclopropane-fatty-acyl-phospholipid synthase
MYAKSLLGGGLGFAESYIDGDWTTDNLTELLRIFVRNISVAHEHEKGIARLRAPLLRLGGFMKRNTRLGSRKNIAAHYDLGNDFFKLWLDDTMTYSSGIFLSERSTMRDASIEKLDRICRALRLTPDDHVLETGTGWGSFAIHAASTYGCRVTTTTISKRQHEIARQRVEAAGLSDRVTLLLKDYRDLEGAYDKLVSIEMIEAVGHNYLDTYLGACSRLLKPDGQMMLQAISMPDQRYKQYLRTSDFIRTHVFPGSCCPSLGALSASIAQSTDMRCVRYEDITGHYAKTLRLWHDRFDEQIEAVRDLGYPDRFIRLWDYYLSYCEAGFAERYIGVGQMLLNKPGCRVSVIGGRS